MSNTQMNLASACRVGAARPLAAKPADMGSTGAFDALLSERTTTGEKSIRASLEDEENCEVPALLAGCPNEVRDHRPKAGGSEDGSEAHVWANNLARSLGEAWKQEADVVADLARAGTSNAQVLPGLSIIGTETHFEAASLARDVSPVDMNPSRIRLPEVMTAGKGPLKLLRISIDRGDAGSVGATIRLRDGSMEVRLEACDPETVALLGEHIAKLAEELGRSGYSVEKVVVHQGGGSEMSPGGSGEAASEGSAESSRRGEDADAGTHARSAARPGEEGRNLKGKHDASGPEPAVRFRSSGVYL